MVIVLSTEKAIFNSDIKDLAAAINAHKSQASKHWLGCVFVAATVVVASFSNTPTIVVFGLNIPLAELYWVATLLLSVGTVAFVVAELQNQTAVNVFRETVNRYWPDVTSEVVGPYTAVAAANTLLLNGYNRMFPLVDHVWGGRRKTWDGQERKWLEKLPEWLIVVVLFVGKWLRTILHALIKYPTDIIYYLLPVATSTYCLGRLRSRPRPMA